MPMRCAALALVVGILMAAPPAAAQLPLAPADSAHAELRTALRAFYFNLAPQDWEAMAADILSAKVVAHRPAPEAFLAMGPRFLPTAADDSVCRPEAAPLPEVAPLVERSSITLDGDWAKAFVPRCTADLVGADEFRFIRFENRWRLVYIELFRESRPLQLAR